MHYSEVFEDYNDALAFLFWYKNYTYKTPKAIREKPYSRRFVINCAGGHVVGSGKGTSLLEAWCKSYKTSVPYKKRVAIRAKVRMLGDG